MEMTEKSFIIVWKEEREQVNPACWVHPFRILRGTKGGHRKRAQRPEKKKNEGRDRWEEGRRGKLRVECQTRRKSRYQRDREKRGGTLSRQYTRKTDYVTKKEKGKELSIGLYVTSYRKIITKNAQPEGICKG